MLILDSKITHHNSSASGRRLMVSCLVVLLCLVWPGTAWAGGDNQEPVPCVQCHEAQADTWGHSPHAQAMTALETAGQADDECLKCHTTHYDSGQHTYAHAGVTCEACHGAYTSDHPQQGVMQLDVDSSVCQDCHALTYAEWHDTAHAQASVQCIGCHQPHSQQTRVEGEALCESCHREKAGYWVHHSADVHCADCHLSAHDTSDITVQDRLVGSGMAPDHSFTPSYACVDCHGDRIHDTVLNEVEYQIDSAQVSTVAGSNSNLADELRDVKRDNSMLRTMSLVTLGFGLGAGGMLGVIFTLVVGYVSQERVRK